MTHSSGAASERDAGGIRWVRISARYFAAKPIAAVGRRRRARSTIGIGIDADRGVELDDDCRTGRPVPLRRDPDPEVLPRSRTAPAGRKSPSRRTTLIQVTPIAGLEDFEGSLWVAIRIDGVSAAEAHEPGQCVARPRQVQKGVREFGRTRDPTSARDVEASAAAFSAVGTSARICGRKASHDVGQTRAPRVGKPGTRDGGESRRVSVFEPLRGCRVPNPNFDLDQPRVPHVGNVGARAPRRDRRPSYGCRRADTPLSDASLRYTRVY